MSTYEALRFFGLDHYATALDIKSAYRRLAAGLHSDSDLHAAELMQEAEARLQMLNRAYAALWDRVGHTSPEVDPLPGAGAKDAAQTAGEWWTRFEVPRVEFSRVGRAAAVSMVMAVVGYGILRGAVAKHFSPSVVDAKTVSVPRVDALRPVTAAVVEKVSPVREKKSAAVARTLRAPALPSLDPEEAQAINSACLVETGDKAEAFRACVLRTAMETPHAIHLD